MTIARLLVVEDNQDNLDLLTVWLSEKYRVFGYRSAQDALAALDAAKPDLLLLDIGLRDINGVDCLKALRAVPGYGSIPAIALTGYARECEREAFQAAGFQAVLAKPVLDDDLFVAIAALLAPINDQTPKLSSAATAA